MGGAANDAEEEDEDAVLERALKMSEETSKATAPAV
jgi:hypothetical protein